MEREWSEVALNDDLHASVSNNSSKNIYVALHTKILQNYSLKYASKQKIEIEIEIELKAIQCTFDVF